MGRLTHAINAVNNLHTLVNRKLGKRAKYVGTSVRVLCATLLAFLLSYILAAPFSISISSLFSSPESNDFQMTDLFAQIADQRPVRQLEDRIILVDIGLANRMEVAEGLHLLSLCGAKKVAVDIDFAYPTENDSTLIEAIACNPGIILPLAVKDDGNGNLQVHDFPFFYGYDGLDIKYGIANLPARTQKSGIREYVVDFATDRGNIPSLAVAIAESTYPEAAKRLRARGENLGFISYHSREFTTIPIEEIAENAELFADKIVLVGSMIDATDMHATPINSYMPGLMIHANSLATILDGVWYHKTSTATDYLAAIIICLIITTLSYSMKSRMRGITLRFIQVIFSYLAVRIGYGIFVDNNTLFDFTYTLLIIAFGLFAVDICNGVEYIVGKWWNQLTQSVTKDQK
jgi:CHASE2 domain-containing sensor protein